MSKPSVDEAQDSVVAEVYIAAPSQRVFQALTQSDQLVRWWGDDK